MAADSPNRWNLLRMLSRCAYRWAQAANKVFGTTPIPANTTVTPTSILEGNCCLYEPHGLQLQPVSLPVSKEPLALGTWSVVLF
ncbi:MAG: hypothetical protein ABSE16_10960 [Verrucomicrobiota bacterium]|jgi:hypothetical protein